LFTDADGFERLDNHKGNQMQNDSGKQCTDYELGVLVAKKKIQMVKQLISI
jgi:hypothetical protein